MSSNTLHLIQDFRLGRSRTTYDFAIIQGKTFMFSFYYTGELLNTGLRGQVRDNYLQEGGNLLASFEFSTEYDIETNKTLVVASLPATVTANIPYTRYQGALERNQLPTIRDSYVYDIEYIENGVVLELYRGFVQVKPEVTNGNNI